MPDPVVATMIMVRSFSGKILLLKRRARDRVYPGAWSLPGGKVDCGEAPDQAVLRELREETGFDLSIDGRFGEVETRSSGGRIFRIQLYTSCCIPERPARISDEHDGWCWASEEEALEMVDRNLTPVTWDFINEVM